MHFRFAGIFFVERPERKLSFAFPLNHEHELLFGNARRPRLFDDQASSLHGQVELRLNCLDAWHGRRDWQSLTVRGDGLFFFFWFIHLSGCYENAEILRVAICFRLATGLSRVVGTIPGLAVVCRIGVWTGSRHIRHSQGDSLANLTFQVIVC